MIISNSWVWGIVHDPEYPFGGVRGLGLAVISFDWFAWFIGEIIRDGMIQYLPKPVPVDTLAIRIIFKNMAIMILPYIPPLVEPPSTKQPQTNPLYLSNMPPQEFEQSRHAPGMMG